MTMTFEEICRISGVCSNKFALANNASIEEISDNAYEKLKLIVKVLNDGWKPNWADSTQYKHYPYFKLNDGKFYCYKYGSYANGPVVGSRLVYKTKELAEFAVENFIDIYNCYLDY